MQPLLQEFGYCADNRTNVEAVLNGTYSCPPTTDKYAKEFIKMLKMPESIKNRETVDLVVTPEQHKQGWRKQKGKVACDYYSLTNEHYKTSIFNPVLNEIDSTLQSTPTEFGFVPQSWCKITDVEIKKTIRKNRNR